MKPFPTPPLFCALNSFVIVRLNWEERAGCFDLFVILVSRGGWAALSRGATGLSAVCDCGIS